MRDLFVLLAIIGFASGIVLGTFYSFPWPLLAFAALLAFLHLVFSRSSVGVAMALCVLALLAGVGRSSLVPQVPPDVFLPLFDTKHEFVGTVIGDPDIRETTQRVTVEVEHEGSRMKLIAIMGLYPELRRVQHVEVVGTLERPEPFDTSGGRVFRYDHFLAKDGIFGIMSFAKVEVVGKASPVNRVFGALDGVKHAFIRGLEQGLPEPYAALAAGIIAGGKQGLGKELLDAFTLAGLVHIVVLSGYNIMIVAEGVLKSLSFLPKRVAAFAAVGVIGLFVLVAGAGAASVRAGIMAGLGLFARATGRTYDALRALLFVLVLMLCANPLLLVYDPGFQFSFAATLGLILGASSIEAHLWRMKPALLRDIIATTLAAQLFVLPLLLYQTGNLSLAALPANIVALPLVPLAMLLSAIAGVVGMIIPVIAPVFALPALATLWYLVEVARIAASLPFASSTVPAFSFVLVPVLYLGVAGIVWVLKRNAPVTRVTGAKQMREVR